MGVQNEFMSEHKTTGDVFNPTLPNIPFNARKNFCLDDCKLTRSNPWFKTLSLKIFFQNVP